MRCIRRGSRFSTPSTSATCLLECLRLFREHAEILGHYQQRLRYILVDEYQDTNVVQYLWLRLLAQASRNLCCVGDDDQSIYGWRGADVDNILRFEHDFPGAKVIRLERNYRSGAHILAVASGLIAHNQNRLGKTLFTEAKAGDKPTVSGVWDSQEEARVIGEEIEALQRAGQSLDEIAILVRASFQMREFEERFITLGLPYRVIGGPRFYERAEIRDALAYLRCVAQPDDDLAFERIFNVPKRGLGEAALQRAARACAPRRPAADARGAGAGRDGGNQGEAAPNLARPAALLRPLVRAGQFDPASRTGATDPGGKRLYRHVEGRAHRRRRRTAGKPERADALDGGVPESGRVPRTCFAGDGRRERRGRRAGVDHDAARRQGPRVRRRLFAGMGGGIVSPPALARRERARRARRGAAARLCRADARALSGENLFRRQSPHSRPVADDPALALHRRIAGGACRGRRAFRRLVARRLWRLALRSRGAVFVGL